jgi:superfamily II DNA/RNA helicase
MRNNSFNKFRFGGTFSYRNKSRRGGNIPVRDRFRDDIDINKFINKAEPLSEKAYEPLNSFNDFNLDVKLLDNISLKGYTRPMEIQDKTIPLAMLGKDVIGLANTGMGKTASFLVPLIQKTLKNQSQKSLIIAPTRELAEQIRSELIELTRRLGIYSVLVIGGSSINRQVSELRGNHHFVIGTPGRLKDLHQRHSIFLRNYNNIVLDEVDRMFDMGFSKDIRLILANLAKPRQSLFFSATINTEVESLIKLHSIEPVRISVVKRETTSNVDQNVVKVPLGKRKIEVLHELLTDETLKKTLIFGRTKWGVQKLAVELGKRGFKVDAIHGAKSQSQRQHALRSFREGRISILVATDVAARGLDIPKVTHIINYEIPDTYTDYIHRIGRTGRGSETGKALTFV